MSFLVVDLLTVAGMAVNLLNIYLAYALTRVTGGAPRAWYFVIAAFSLLFVRNVFQLYLDFLAHNLLTASAHEAISLAVQILFSLGLYSLIQVFRRQLKITSEAKLTTTSP